jgi:hypothetical protein
LLFNPSGGEQKGFVGLDGRDRETEGGERDHEKRMPEVSDHSRPRGNLFRKPVTYPEMLRRRRRFVPVYVAVWICVIAMLGLALSRPHLPFIV